MKKNVYLVDLGTGSNRNLLPLGVSLISSYAKSIPELDEAFNFNIHFLRGDTVDIIRGFDRPAIIGFALYVWNYRASMRVAAAAKAANPSALIVCGGYSVPKAPEKIVKFFAEFPFIDILVHGEGEVTFADLARAVAEGRDLATVAGITFRNPDAQDGFVTTGRRDRISDLDMLPSPFLNGTFDDIMRRHGQHVTGVIWETNRGCPFSCTFCDWGNADVNKIKSYAMDRLRAEIDWIARNKIFYIYLADANFGIFYDRDLEISGYLAEAGKQHHFPGYMAINWTKNTHERITAIAERLSSGGVQTSVTFAVQSFNDKTLAAIKRRNIKTESLMKLKKEYQERNLPTYTEMILGLPEETYETFTQGLNQSMTPGVSDHWVFHLCTLLINTEMESTAYREKYGILSRWVSAGIARRTVSQKEEAAAEIEEIVVGTASMPPEAWARSFAVGYLSAALYNFRPAFFVMLHAQNEIGNEHTHFIEFLLEQAEADPEGLPWLRKLTDHVARQRQMILDNVAMLSPIDELNGALALTHEAVLAIALHDADAFYGDLAELTRRFFARHDHSLDEALLTEIISYQRCRIPLWGEQERRVLNFRFNIPAYFAALTKGLPAPDLVEAPNALEVVPREMTANDKGGFAVQRTRSGHTIILNEVKVINPAVREGLVA
ncbi:MAG: hypothetical protein RL477_1637 [Pseudomonadota bacterium]|jgi:radical SAM superfamily enzyme YgiQ (UPF0313 family)